MIFENRVRDAANSMKKLKPFLKSAVWGGEKLKKLFNRGSGGCIAESWEVSVHPDGECATDCGTLSEYLKQNPAAVSPEGGQLPVLIKYIDASANLSVQVHPDDEYARRVEGDGGKTELWYIVEAEEGAGIYCGFRRDTSKEEFLQYLNEGRAEELLNFIPVKAGESYLIGAGTVHSILAGCVVLEIQQSSNVTYRVYDYGRKDKDGNARELHIGKALDVMNFFAYSDRRADRPDGQTFENRLRPLSVNRSFGCSELKLDGSFTNLNSRSFTAVNIIEGSGVICGSEFCAGDSFFLDCGERLTVSGKATLVLTCAAKPAENFIGIDLGGTYIKGGIFDGNGKLLLKKQVRTPKGYADTVKEIARLADSLESETGSFARGIGIGCPGSVDGKAGRVLYSNNLQWKDKPLCSDLKKLTLLPVTATNDANAAALGEYFCGAGKNYNSFVMLTVGTGVGCGIVLNGKLMEGNNGVGAEFGHSVIRCGGKKCTCGRRGCLEAYASVTALNGQTETAMLKDKESLMWDICGDISKIDGKTAFDGMRAGDKTAERVVRSYIRYLAEGVADAINIFRPDAVILGGGICAEGDALLVPLKRMAYARIFGGYDIAPVEITVAELKNDAGISGAAKLAMDAEG